MRYFFGGFELDSDLPLLLKEGATVAISPRALAALVLLIERRHTAVSRRELTEALWPDSFVEEGSLAQLISGLRKVLAAEFPERSPIQTISKVGYRFVAEISERAEPVGEVAADGRGIEVAREERLPGVEGGDAAEEGAGRGGGWLRGTWRLAGVVTLLIGCVALPLAWWRRMPAAAAKVAPVHASVAVMPFQDMTNEAASGWVGVAAQEMLGTDLRLSRGVRVIPVDDVNRALAELHISPTADPGGETLRRLNRDLDRDYLLTGGYLLRDGRIRMDVRLVDLRTKATVNERSYERLEAELLPMLSEVRAQAAGALGVPADADAAAADYERLNPEAYRLYAQGLAELQRYGGKQASVLLEKALALEPNFALGHLALSMAWSQQGDETRAGVEAERAQAAAGKLPREQQLEIDGRVQSVKHRFAAAAETYRALLRFYPENPEYGRLLVQSLTNSGQSEAALHETQGLLRAQAGNEASDPMLDSVVADLYSSLGRWPESLSWAERGAAESERRGATILYERLLTTVSQAEFYLKRYDEASRHTVEALGLAREYHDVSGELRAENRLGQIATERGDFRTADGALRAALEMEEHFDQRQRELHTLITLSKLHGAMGDLNPAYEFAERAVKLADSLGFADAEIEATLQLAVLTGQRGDRARALTRLNAVSARAAQIQDVYLQSQARLEVAKLTRDPHGRSR